MSRGDGNILFDKRFVKAIAKKEKDPGETFPGEALSLREAEEILYPIIWETSEEIDGERRLARFGGLGYKSSVCHELAQYLAQGEIGKEIDSHYAAWEKKAIDTGVYAIISKNKNISSRGDLIKMWGGLFSSLSRESRILTLKKHLRDLSDKDISTIIQSLPTPHQLVVSGDSSIREDPKRGRWSLEPFELA